MANKLQLEVHMSSSQHKNNHPIAPPAALADPFPVQNNQQFFNFESSSYGYGFRNWTAEQNLFNRSIPQMTSFEGQQKQEMDNRLLVERAKNELLARFPFYAINLQHDQIQSHPASFSPDDIPMPVEAPANYEQYDFHAPESGYNFNY